MKGLILGNGEIINIIQVRNIKVTGCEWIEIICKAFEDGSIN